MSTNALTAFPKGEECMFCLRDIKDGDRVVTMLESDAYLATEAHVRASEAEAIGDVHVDLDWNNQWIAHAACFAKARQPIIGGPTKESPRQKWLRINRELTKLYQRELTAMQNELNVETAMANGEMAAHLNNVINYIASEIDAIDDDAPPTPREEFETQVQTTMVEYWYEAMEHSEPTPNKANLNEVMYDLGLYLTATYAPPPSADDDDDIQLSDLEIGAGTVGR